MFHVLTGCDTVSFFFGGRGKKTAWNAWKAYITPAFCASAAMPNTQTIEQWLDHLEQFVALCTQKKAIDGLPPTQTALIQHVKRAAYQAGHCCAQTMMIATPELSSPSE